MTANKIIHVPASFLTFTVRRTLLRRKDCKISDKVQKRLDGKKFAKPRCLENQPRFQVLS